MAKRTIKPKATGRMTRRDHPTRASAIKEAYEHGYWQKAGMRGDGLYILTNGKDLLAIRREVRPRSTVYHLVEAPTDYVTIDELINRPIEHIEWHADETISEGSLA